MRLQCHTTEQMRLYERGYPYMAILVDGHKDDKKPAAAATKVFREYYGVYHAEWPRRVAHAFARASGVVDGDWQAAEVLKAASSTADVTADEARSIVAAILAHGGDSIGIHEVFKPLFVLEAIAGTDVVLGAAVDALEQLPPKQWNADGPPALMAYATGLLLLRSSNRAPLEKRLEALYQKAASEKVSEGEHTIRGGLDLALHGNAGAARALANSDWQYWYYYLMVDDSAVHLSRLKDSAKSEWVPESRILWLAGDDLWPVYTSKKALRQGKRLPHILGDFGMFEDDRVLSLMVDMVGVKGAGDAPSAYFRANAAYARPKLEKLAKGGGAAALKANAALKMT